jgi:hypothetical protein
MEKRIAIYTAGRPKPSSGRPCRGRSWLFLHHHPKIQRATIRTRKVIPKRTSRMTSNFTGLTGFNNREHADGKQFKRFSQLLWALRL